MMLSGWNNPPRECCGTWTPDGKYFVFRSRRSGVSNIWAVNETKSFFRKVGREPVQLTSSPAPTFFPLVSPDGKKIFVVASQVRGELVSYNATSRQFSPYLSGISAMGVYFSEDGNWVAYSAYPEGTLWRSKVDGSERVQLTFPPMYVLQARWSPDGTRIAFAGQEPGKPYRVYVIPAVGGSAEQLVSGDHGGLDPTWSPDGNSLLFGRHPSLDRPLAGPAYLEVVDLQTRKISKIPDSKGLWCPRWSRDGLHILAMPWEHMGLVVFDVRTQNWTALNSVARIAVNWPEWSRQGDWIYFYGSPIGGKEGVFRVRIKDGKLDEVFGLENFQQAPGLGTWKGLAPDNTPLLTRDAGTMNIYALDVDFP